MYKNGQMTHQAAPQYTPRVSTQLYPQIFCITLLFGVIHTEIHYLLIHVFNLFRI